MWVRRSSLAVGILCAGALVGCDRGAAGEQGSEPAPVEVLAMDEGLRYLNEGNGVAAATIFRTILASTPTHYGAQYQLARALDMAGLPAEARIEWNKSLQMAEAIGDSSTITAVRERLQRGDAPSSEQLMARGIGLLYGTNQPDSAALLFRQILKTDPKHYGALFQLARSLELAGKTAEARATWERFLPLAEAAGDAENVAFARKALGR